MCEHFQIFVLLYPHQLWKLFQNLGDNFINIYSLILYPRQLWKLFQYLGDNFINIYSLILYPRQLWKLFQYLGDNFINIYSNKTNFISTSIIEVISIFRR